MDTEAREIELVERAAAYAWARVPKPAQHRCIENVPPSVPYVLDPFVWHTAEWLREHGDNVFGEVCVVQGTAPGSHGHAWIETVAPRRVIDVSTPSGSDMHLVASDATLALAAEREYNIYYRRISIVPVSAAGVYVRTQAMAPPAAPAEYEPRTPIGRVLCAFLQSAGNRQFMRLDSHVDTLAECFLLPDSLSDPEAVVCARVYARILYNLLCKMWQNMFDVVSTGAQVDELFESIGKAWKAVFGFATVWHVNRDALVTCTALRMNEQRDLNAVSVAYQRACGAYEAVIAETETRVLVKLAKGRPSRVCVPTKRTPAYNLLLTLLSVDSTSNMSRAAAHPVAMQVAQCYPPRVLQLLERVRDLVMAGRAEDFSVFKMKHDDIGVLGMLWVPSEQKPMCEQFLAAAAQFARGKHAEIGAFQAMQTAWSDLDALYYADAGQVVAPKVEPSKPVAAARAVVQLRYAVDEDLGGAHVECSVPEATENEAQWKAIGTLEDLMGNSWTLEVPDCANAPGRGIRVFMESLTAQPVKDVSEVNAVRATMELPPDARLAEQQHPWVRRTAPFVIAPMLWRMSAQQPPADPWLAFVESVRRAVQVLICTTRRALKAVIVPCPPQFALTDTEPDMHEIDQWLVYFMAMPPHVNQFLDAQRKRFSASFLMQRGAVGGKARAFVRIAVRPATRHLTVAPSGAGGARTLDARLSDAIWDWLSDKGAEKSVYATIPAFVLRAAAEAAIDAHKCVIRPEHIAEDMPKFYRLVRDFMHTGMLFATRRKHDIVLEIFRDVSHFFELAYTKNMLTLAAAARSGALPDTAASPLHIELSSGYLADGVKSAHEHLETTVVVRPGGWRNDTLAFLAGWVRGHLCRAVQRHVVLRLSPLRIEFLPSVELMCRERGVYFMVAVHLANKLERRRSETFTVCTMPTFDRESGLCTVDLGDVLARWMTSRVLSYGDAEGTHVRVAPYTTASGKVYLHTNGAPPTAMGTFLADSATSNYVRGNSVHVECATHDVSAEVVAAQRAHTEARRLAVFGIMCGTNARVSDADALRAVHSLAGYKYFDSFREMPLYAELAERVPPDEFPRAVVREYYTNPNVHPAKCVVLCRFDVRSFVRALYGRENAFLMSVQ